jgi:DNA-binding NarL/FixJ family response regulator
VSGVHVKAQNERPTIGRSAVADIRVLVVDDHRAFRDVLQDLVAAAPGFALVGFASSGEEALREVTRVLPEFVLMDVAMPGIGGIAAAREIVRNHPDIAVLLVSVDDPARHLAGEQLGDRVTSLPKQHLSPEELRRSWDRLRDSAGGGRS